MITTGTKIRELLNHDHQQLDAMLGAVLERIRTESSPEIVEQWAGYEDSLLSHLDAEEMYLLPTVATRDGDAVRTIRHHHDAVRASLAEIGIGIALHQMKLQELRIVELARFLQEHAAMEDAVCYRRLDVHVSEVHYQALVGRLRSTWERIVALPTSTRSSQRWVADSLGHLRTTQSDA